MDFDGVVRELRPADMAVAYRGCATLKSYVALGAVFAGHAGLGGVHRAAHERLQPETLGCRSPPRRAPAACSRIRPTIPAGKLIDELGLKGSRVGGARVSQEHGNFLVNDGNATAADVLELIALLQARGAKRNGASSCTPEVEIIGE